jgi:hypothetical protein
MELAATLQSWVDVAAVAGSDWPARSRTCLFAGGEEHSESRVGFRMMGWTDGQVRGA